MLGWVKKKGLNKKEIKNSGTDNGMVITRAEGGWGAVEEGIGGKW